MDFEIDRAIAGLREKVDILEAEIRVMRKLPAAIDAALSGLPAPDPAEAMRQCDCCGKIRECESIVAFGMDTTACAECRRNPPAPQPKQEWSRESKRIWDEVPAPDPAEAMRALCEAIARDMDTFEGDAIANAIAALKGRDPT